MIESLTKKQFTAMFPEAAGTTAANWCDAFALACAEFSITTPARLAAFFAQVHHESAGLTRLEENLRYTPARLMAVFPFAFRTPAIAAEYSGRGPVAIASRAYAKRMGNGPESSGDGYRYRGRGPIQLTGRNNYAEFGAALRLPLVEQPGQASEPYCGARVAARFWATRGCNALADAGAFMAITRAINGGTNGLRQRIALWDMTRAALGVAVAEQRIA